MVRFPVIDSALEGFRVTRERPQAVALWAAVLLAANLLLLTGMVALGLGPVITAVKPFEAVAPTPELLARTQAAGPWLPGLLAAVLAVNAVLYTAVLRAVLEPADKRYGYLRLGWQELRQVGLWLYALGAFLGFQLLLAVVETAGAAAGQATPGDGGRLVLAAVSALAFVAVLYPVVRLSLAPSATFVDRRIRLFSTWPVTRGQFWGLLGCYAVAALLALAVAVLSYVVVATLVTAAATMAGAEGAVQSRLDKPDLSTLAAFLRPETLVSVATNALLMALILAILAAPAPFIYRTLRETEGS